MCNKAENSCFKVLNQITLLKPNLLPKFMKADYELNNFEFLKNYVSMAFIY